MAQILRRIAALAALAALVCLIAVPAPAEDVIDVTLAAGERWTVPADRLGSCVISDESVLRLEDGALDRLDEQVVYSFWEKPDEGHTVIRLASSWATTAGETDQLIRVLTQIISAP